jgi:hypothetical protein
MPSVRAVWLLITSSNLFNCMIGRSSGFWPFRMRPALDITRVLEALSQCAQRLSKPFGRLRVEEPDYGYPGLLRPRRHWPRRAADHPDNLATTQLTKLHPLPLAKVTQHNGLSRIA